MTNEPMTNEHTNDDPRPGFASACATAFVIITKVQPDDLQRSTPCADYDVSALLAHMITAIRRPRHLALGENPFAQPEVSSDTPAQGWSDLFAAEMVETLGAWTDSAVLDQMMELPWAQLPGRAMLATYIPELTVHTWDLAQAVGATPEWVPSVLKTAIGASAQLLPDGPRETMTLPNGMPIPFASAVEVDDDAPAIDRLVAWYGRQPR